MRVSPHLVVSVTPLLLAVTASAWAAPPPAPQAGSSPAAPAAPTSESAPKKADEAAAEGLKPIKVLNVGTRPESVTKGFGGKYYITVMGEPGEQSDGLVRVLTGDTVSDFARELDEPKGICFTGKFLVVSDVKRVWRIDAKGEKTVLADDEDFPTPPSYLNDVSCEPGGRAVYVTDMGANTKMRDPKGALWPLDSEGAKALPAVGRIYRIGLDHKITEVVAPDAKLPNPNGVAAQSRTRILFTDFFTGTIFQKTGKKTTVLAQGLRGADGIERDRRGTIYVSSWEQGKLWRLRPAGGKAAPAEVTIIAEGYQAAADFYLDHAAKLILLPDMKAGTLSFLPLR